MNFARARLGAGLVVVSLVLCGSLMAASDIPLGDWPVPSTAGKGYAPLADIGILGSFQAMVPCRVADTRSGAGFTGAYGPPSLVASTARSFNIQASPCTGIPSGASAYSLNFTVIASGGAYQNAFLSAWQK